MASDWITTTEAIELSGYHPVHLRRLVRTGKIKAQKWMHEWQISKQSLRSYLKAAEVSGDNRRGAKK